MSGITFSEASGLNDSIFGKALIFVGLAEGVALYGLLVALLMLFM